MKLPFQKYDLILLCWNDASALSDGWKDEIEPDEPKLALSVGFLLRETKEHIVIAQDLDPHGHHNGRSQIPKGMIKHRQVLRKKDAK